MLNVYQYGTLRTMRTRRSWKDGVQVDLSDLPDDHVLFTHDELAPFIDQLLTRMSAMVGVGIRLEVTHRVETASTDCRHVVHFNPEPFMEGHVEAGFGRGYHEVGHILYDRNGTALDPKRSALDAAYGTLLLERANAEGGERCANVLNLIMDRRSDDLQMKEFPGNANALRYRLPHLMPGERFNKQKREVEKRLNGTAIDCDRSVFVDFAYAIKKRTRPKHAVVRTCVQHTLRAIHRVNSGTRPYAHLLTVAMEVEQRLADAEPEHAQPKADPKRLDSLFQKIMRMMARAERGGKPSKAFTKAFREHMKGKLKVRRAKTLATLPATLKALVSHMKGGGRVAGTDESKKNIEVVPPNPTAYRTILVDVANEGRRLREILRMLSMPVSNVLRGLNQGEFDLEALPAFVSGQSDVMMIEQKQQKLDVAFALLLDVSGSMKGQNAHRIAVVFNEALLASGKEVSSHLFAFNDKVFDCGNATPNNGIVGIACGGGTNETFGVYVAGDWLAHERRRVKVLLTICDGAPADPEAVRKETLDLLKQGILPLRILVGVDVAPKTYPIELFFDSWSEFNQELAHLFQTVFQSAQA